MVKDPVSGILFDPRTAIATRYHSGNLLYFESQETVDIYDQDPHYYGHPDEDDFHHGNHKHRHN